MQLPLAYLDASVIEEISLDLWRKVFEVVGWPSSIVGKPNTFTHDDVFHSFEHDNPTDDLLQAIEALHVLGTESGRDAIAAAMNDRRVPTDTLPASTGEREFAVHLFLAQRSDASLADVFARAQTQVQEGAEHRRYNEFLGKEARSVACLKAKSEALQEETLRYCRDADLGEHVHIRAFDDDGAVVFQIVRSHHTKKPLAVVRGRAARATIEYRPVHADILRYDAAVGRLRIAARAASVVEFYRRTLGRLLFDDELFFAGDPVCSLKVLQERGRKALEQHGVPGIGRTWMTECLWERGDRKLLQIRSTDCFNDIEELHLPLREGEFLQIKLKLEVVGSSTRPVTVNVRAPSRIEITQKRHEQIVDRFLTRVGIRCAPIRSPEADLWSLHPWRHPVAVWRALFGGETESLVRNRVLVPIQLGSVSSAENAGAGRVLEAHAISTGEFYGVSQTPEIPSRSLSSTDLDGLEFDPEQFRHHLRSRLSISGASISWEGHEMLDLGVIEVSGQRLRFTYALRHLPSGAGDSIRARAAGAHPVVLIPTTHHDGSEIAKVMLEQPLPSRERLLRDAIAACGLANALPAVFSAPHATRLVVDTRRGQVWIDGLEIPGIRAGTQPFRLVEILARKCPDAVSTDHLTTELSGGRMDGDTTARQAKAAVRKSIREAMAAAGRAFEEDPFPSVQTGCYRCALVSYVV